MWKILSFNLFQLERNSGLKWLNLFLISGFKHPYVSQDFILELSFTEFVCM